MYVALLFYKGSLEDLKSSRKEHRAFLRERCAQGDFLVVGEMMSDKGEVILSPLTRLGDFEQLLRQDPFIQQGLVTYKIVAFDPSETYPGFTPLIREPEREEVELLPYSSAWEGKFEKEAQAISQALEDNLVAIHHIGSTSIPGIVAKPIVDILPVVKDITHVDEGALNMEALGYEAKGEYGIPGRRFFQKRVKGKRVFNVHIFEKGHPDVERHLIFRDYLKDHPHDALLYSDLKKKLVQKSPTDIEKYCWGKNEFVKLLEKRAKKWKDSGRTS